MHMTAVVRYRKGERGERPWGRWEVLEIGERYCVKRIDVLPAARLSLQFHHHRGENWMIVDGEGVVDRNGEHIAVARGAHVHIPQGAKHRITNTGDAVLTFIEVQQGDLLDENDIVRLEDDYGR